MSTTAEIMLELLPGRVPTEEESWPLGAFEELQLKPKHSIFLSHSGAQKNFVEQLCEDLERIHLTPFFDKRPDSLPKGEVFAQYIFKAAQQCELAIVVVSEEYFSRSKWPMLELCAFVHSSKCKILPLFFGLSCKEFGDLERRERWFRVWDAWAQADPRVRVDEWKNALREVDRRNGLVYLEASGEVVYRKLVVDTVSDIMQKSLHDEIPSDFPTSEQPSRISNTLFLEVSVIILKVIGGIAGFLFISVIFTLFYWVFQEPTRTFRQLLLEWSLFFFRILGVILGFLVIDVLFMLFFFKIIVPIFKLIVIPRNIRNRGLV